MRGEASRIADRESRDSLAPKLRDTREDAWRIGNELFTITKVLDDSIQLERALTDPSRPVADKVAVLKELLGDNAHPMTMEIMTDLVSRRWSRARDIANAVEDFGVDAMMYYADATDATLQVSIELSELHSALLNLPVVRAKLYDYQATSEARVKLFREVFSGKTLNKVTMRLAEHATCNLRRRRYLETIQWLINKFSRHMGESMVTVTTATPLKGADQATGRGLLRQGGPSGAHQLGGRPDRAGWHAHPGGRRSHGQHRGRTAAELASQGADGGDSGLTGRANPSNTTHKQRLD